MLDFAQIKSGKFRKNFTKFNVVESINEIIDVLKFKANTTGI